uniref:hypothetical protein n=1 Tax=Rhodococcus erythropolis TaxID=1833 RepID=UPI00209C2118|nr:hypothetical protein [Rhodococcus erythropolis]
MPPKQGAPLLGSHTPRSPRQRASARGGSVSVSAAAFGGGEETACDEAGLALLARLGGTLRRMPRRRCSPATAARFRPRWGWRGHTLTTVTRTSLVVPRWWGGRRIIPARRRW